MFTSPPKRAGTVTGIAGSDEPLRQRIFVALPLPAAAVAQLADAQRAIVEMKCFDRRQLRLVPEHQFHVTLAFLGDIVATLVPLIVEVTTRVVSPYAPLYLRPTSWVTFPSTHKPRIIALEFAELSGQLDAMVHQLNHSLLQQAIAIPARAFRAHTTVARLREIHPTRHPFTGPTLPTATWCERVVVYRSELRTQGAHHFVQGTAWLTGQS